MKKIILALSVFLFSFSFFSQAQSYQTNGSCVQVTPRCFRLTDSTTLLGGNFFSTTQINLNNPFDLTFFINFGCYDVLGADGIAFILQNSTFGTGALGGIGAGMGYTGSSIITPSLAVEFDTNPNTFEGYPDPSYDHIAIIKNGDLTVNQAGPVQISAFQANVEDCVCHKGRIQWTPSLNRLRIYFDGILRLTYNNNIITNYFASNPNVYWGFGGGTGAYYNIQTVSIDFADAGNNLSVCQGSGVQLSGTGGTTYLWSPSTGLSNSTISNPIASPTVNTTYTLTATNSTGCSDTSVVKISVNPLPSVNAGADKFICPGTSTVLSGTGTGSTYLWSPSTGLNNNTSLTPTASPNSTTTYTIVASSALGCTESDVAVVNVYSAPNPNAGASQSVCTGGSVQLNASGGLTYSWSPSLGLTNSTINNPIATISANTTFTVSVTDDHSCEASDTVSVHILAAPSASAGNDLFICSNSSTHLNATGGIGYAWSPSTGLSSSTIFNPICFASATTTYTVIVTNATGCTANDQVVVTVYPPTTPPSILPLQPTICAGSSVTITASGSINYSWYPSTGLNTTFGATVVASPTITTNYTVAGNDINGCVASRFFSVIVNGIPAIATTTITDTQCPGSGAIDIGMNTGAYSFVWNTGATTEDIAGLTAGIYVVTVTGNGCNAVDSITVAQALLPKPQNLLVNNLTSCSARLNWSAVLNMSYYKVRYRQTGTTAWSVPVNVGSNLFYDFTGLNSALNFQFQVSAYCANNATGGWMTKAATTKVCTTPVNISVATISSTSVLISWIALCSSNNFQVIYRKVGTTQWLQQTTTATMATLINLQPSNSYEFKIKAICTGGASAYSALQNFTTPVMRNENGDEELFNIEVFPNPTTGIINVELISPSFNYSLEITNVLGEKIWSSEAMDRKINIDLSNEAAGIYFLIYRDEKRVETKRVIVER
ncbi:hypothetical protein LBMAG27_16180 [Bacteroidota bacterium]|nr:hypothetical protein LBMAG27_16180 [Bacteroidota bacterium]